MCPVIGGKLAHVDKTQSLGDVLHFCGDRIGTVQHAVGCIEPQCFAVSCWRHTQDFEKRRVQRTCIHCRSVETVEKLVRFYVAEHNTRLPHSAFEGRPRMRCTSERGSTSLLSWKRRKKKRVELDWRRTVGRHARRVSDPNENQRDTDLPES